MGLFDFFKKGESIYTPSLYFLNNPLRDKYFARTAQFMYVDAHTIVALDTNYPRTVSFDPWPQRIFLEASGKITVYELLVKTAKEYRGRVPDLLDETIINELQTLINEKLIITSDEPIHLSEMLSSAVKKKS